MIPLFRSSSSVFMKRIPSVRTPVPLFINEGDVIRINTETGEYNDRISTK